MNFIKTPCPYCGHPEMPRPPKSARPYAACPNCGKHSRAVIFDIADGSKQVRYVATSSPRLKRSDLKKVRSIRLSDNEMNLVEAGHLRLTVSNGRITLAV